MLHNNFDELEFSQILLDPELVIKESFKLKSIVSEIYKECNGAKNSKQLKMLYDCYLIEYVKIENALEEALTNLTQEKSVK